MRLAYYRGRNWSQGSVCGLSSCCQITLPRFTVRGAFLRTWLRLWLDTVCLAPLYETSHSNRCPTGSVVGNWRYITDDGIEHPIKTKTDWISEWRHMGIAFRWSILPDKQSLEPGDWNQGFTTVSLPPDSTLDLIYTWRNQDEEHEAILEGLSCAPEKLPG